MNFFMGSYHVFALSVLLLCCNTTRQEQISQTDLEQLASALEHIEQEYKDVVSIGEVKEVMLQAAMEALDPFSWYMTPAETQAFKAEMHSKLEGEGVAWRTIKDKIVAMYVRKDGPAAKAKPPIRVGDELVAINNKKPASIEEALSLLQGAAGTPISCSVLRKDGMADDKLVSLRFKLAEIPDKSVPTAYFVTPQIGYVKLRLFSRDAAPAVEAAIKGLMEDTQHTLRGIMLDLRNNLGGFIQSAVELADLFLPKGKVVAKQLVRHQDPYLWTTERDVVFDLPIAILIDGNTASASELFTGAMQYYDKTKPDNKNGLVAVRVVGQHSLGKGLVHQVFPLPGNAALRLAIGEYFTPADQSLQKPYISLTQKPAPTQEGTDKDVQGGISPDIEVTNAPLGRALAFATQGGALYAAVIDYHKTHQEQLLAQGMEQYIKPSFYPQQLYSDFLKQHDRLADNSDDVPITPPKDHLKLVLKACLAETLWGPEARIQVYNKASPVVNEAVYVLEKKLIKDKR